MPEGNIEKVVSQAQDTASRASQNLEKSAKRIWQWVKDHPAVAGVIIGGVILLALWRARSGPDYETQGEALADTAEGGLEDIGISNGAGEIPAQFQGLEPVSPTGDLTDLGLTDLETLQEPENLGEIVYAEENGGSSWYQEEAGSTPSGSIQESEPVGADYYKKRSEELEQLASEADDPNIRSLLADASRETGEAGFYLGLEESGDLEAYQESVERQIQQGRRQSQSQAIQRGREAKSKRLQKIAEYYKSQKSKSRQKSSSDANRELQRSASNGHGIELTRGQQANAERLEQQAQAQASQDYPDYFGPQQQQQDDSTASGYPTDFGP